MLNKTLKESAKKTKSVPKPIGIFLVAVVTAIGVAFVSSISIQDSCKGLQRGDTCIALEHAESSEARERGLSGRSELAEQSGMLFMFDSPQQRCIWMKDMQFSIDIVWLDAGKKVTKIMEQVSPNTYPESFCADDAQYVIELPAGDIGKFGIATGERLTF